MDGLTPEVLPRLGAGGAPTTYREEYCSMLLDFFRSTPMEIERKTTTKTISEKGPSLKEETRSAAGRLPTFERFADTIDTTVRTLQEWADRHEKFARAYAQAKQIQKDHLIQNGYGGLVPAQALVFLATNLTDMRNRQEVTGADGAPLVSASLDGVPMDALEQARMVLDAQRQKILDSAKKPKNS